MKNFKAIRKDERIMIPLRYTKSIIHALTILNNFYFINNMIVAQGDLKIDFESISNAEKFMKLCNE